MAGRVRTHRDLVVWQRAMALAKAIYSLTTDFPATERFGLTLQMRRAGVSIASNIAEGHARHGRGDYLRHLGFAMGSLAELDTQTRLAVDLSMATPQEAGAVLLSIAELQVLMQSLYRAVAESATPP